MTLELVLDSILVAAVAVAGFGAGVLVEQVLARRPRRRR
jgi:hypothetical protein